MGNNVKATSLLKWPFGENFFCHAVEKPIFNNVYPSCIENMPTTSAPSAAASGELLASLFERRKEKLSIVDQDAINMLEDLGKMMEERGISLLSVMKKLKNL